jgi:hypothetical protein
VHDAIRLVMLRADFDLGDHLIGRGMDESNPYERGPAQRRSIQGGGKVTVRGGGEHWSMIHGWDILR